MLLIAILIVVVAGIVLWNHKSNLAEQKTADITLQQADRDKAARQAAKSKAEAAAAAATPTVFSKQKFSIDDPNSIWIIVNKLRPLSPNDYAPKDLVTPAVPLRSASGGPEMQLRKEAATAFETMVKAAKSENVDLMLASAYRSFATQTSVYNREVSQFGQPTADTQSARPGYSEHQTGLGVDIEPTSRQCEIEDCFADTNEGKWLAANATKYGFLLRYTADKTAITGYRAESWHYRYIGLELANEMTKQGILTLEEFFGLPAAPGY